MRSSPFTGGGGESGETGGEEAGGGGEGGEMGGEAGGGCESGAPRSHRSVYPRVQHWKCAPALW